MAAVVSLQVVLVALLCFCGTFLTHLFLGSFYSSRVDELLPALLEMFLSRFCKTVHLLRTDR